MRTNDCDWDSCERCTILVARSSITIGTCTNPSVPDWCPCRISRGRFLVGRGGPLAYMRSCHLASSYSCWCEYGDKTNVSADCQFLWSLFAYKLSSHMLLYLFSVQIPSGKESLTESCEKKDCEQGCEDNCRQSTRFREATSSMSWSHMILVRWPTKISYCTRDEGLWRFIKTWNCRSFFLENWVKYRSKDSLDPRPYSLVLFPTGASYNIIQYSLGKLSSVTLFRVIRWAYRGHLCEYASEKVTFPWIDYILRHTTSTLLDESQVKTWYRACCMICLEVWDSS